MMVALALLGLAISAFMIRQYGTSGAGWLPACSFHRLTGWFCPGCGMTRASHAALHGRFAEAFRFNPLGVLAMPLVAAILVFHLPRWLRGQSDIPFMRIRAHALWGITALVAIYWILRNLPIWPFTLLAPP